jgi:hypothetical protein
MTELLQTAAGTQRLRHVHHVPVFRRKDVFAGHPFNSGFESYGDGAEMVVGYSTQRCRVLRHPDGSLSYPMEPSGDSGVSRSTDGGRTWSADEPYSFKQGRDLHYTQFSAQRRVEGAAAAPIDPFDGSHGLHCFSNVVFTTRDRGRTWTGPSFLPHDGHTRCDNRPVFLVRPDGALLTFPTVNRRDGHEGRVAVYASYDGGVTWSFLSFMAQDDSYFCIMPTAVNLPSGRILAAVRCNTWTQMHDSCDGGQTWRYVGRLNDHGMPTQLLRLKDGRIVAVYGYRLAPSGIRARVAEDDEGRRWGPELVLRDDGASDDLGYPRGAVAPDGTVVVCYYFHEKKYPKPPDVDTFHWGTRSIWATRFTV